MKKLGRVLVIVGLVVLVPTFLTVNYVCNVARKTATGVIDRTTNPDNVIYNYEWFKLQYQQIQANATQIQNSQTELDNFQKTHPAPLSFMAEQELSRLNANITGLKNFRATTIAEYNAKSKMANRNIFKSKELPESIGE